MKAPSAHSPFLKLEHPAACTFLVEPSNLLVLDPFFENELSVSKLASKLSITQNAAFKWVRKLEELGLIECTNQIKRKGKAIKCYRSTAPAFFVPFSSIPAEQFIRTLNERNWQMLLGAMGKIFSETQLVEQGYGAITSRSPNGRIGLLPAQADGKLWNVLLPEFPAFLGNWLLLRLDFKDAKTLQLELTTLLEKYMGKNGAGDYMTGVFMVERQKS